MTASRLTPNRVAIPAALMLGIITSQSAAQPRYVVTDAGNLGGDFVSVSALNDLGQIVGAARTPDAVYHAFLWLPEPDYALPAGIHDLEEVLQASVSFADINNFGQVCLNWVTDELEPWGEHIVLAYRWDLATGKLVQIGSLPAGNSTLCTSLNDPGQLVGRVPEKLFGTRAFVWLPESAFGLPSGIHDLGSVRGCCPRAEDINSFGEIVGTSETDIVGSERAFIWLPAPNHGLPAGSHVLDDRLAARAVAISDSGQILINTESQAFVWEAGKLTNVGSLEGSFTRAEDINSLGQVAGYARTADKGFVIHAFLWENGVIVDLNDAIPAESRWTVQEGRAINERGQIAASGIADGSEHVLLLTRLPSVVTSSPPSCAIDARQPSNLDGSNPIGWRSVVLTFDAQPGRLDPQDFRVQLDPPGASPQIASVTTTGRTVTLQFERGIPPGHWTLLTHVASESTVRLGYLPGDVNGDGSSSPLDILALVDGLNGLDSLDLWQCDIDRSNHCEPADILRVIDVLNGAGTLEPWLQRALSACP